MHSGNRPFRPFDEMGKTMKIHLYYSIVVFLAVLQCSAADPTTYLWGPETNSVQMTIMVKAASEEFSMDDIKFPPIIERLTHQSDPLSSFLWQSLSKEQQDMLKDYGPSSATAKPAEELVLQVLNKIIREGGIFSVERFKGIDLRAETRMMLQGMPAGPGHLSRFLLEDAFPSELSRTIKGGAPTIKMGDSVILTAVFTNKLRNQSFYMSTRDSYTFEIATPSGKRIMVSEDHRQDLRSQAFQLGELGFRVFTLDVSGLYKFDEIGSYIIKATGHMGWPENNRGGFPVVSNPLTIEVAPVK
jgi:hypothetical protein